MNHDVRKVIAILGIPRSGTTVLTAALSVAPDVTAVYEPFNADEHERWREGAMTADRLLADYRVDTQGRRALVVKETCRRFEYVDLLRQVLAEARPPRQRSLLVTMRNPLHCFLSETQGRREWWNEPDLEISAQLFDGWARRRLSGLDRTLDLLHDVGGMWVSYSALVRRPEELTTIVGQLGLTVTGNEATFYERMDTSKVRGDVSLKRDPRPLGVESDERRGRELPGLVDRVSSSEWLGPVQQLATAIDELSSKAAIAAADPRVGEFRALLRTVMRRWRRRGRFVRRTVAGDAAGRTPAARSGSRVPQAPPARETG